MAEGTFRNILSSPLPPATIQTNLSVKFAQGEGILLGLVNLYSDVAQAQTRCAALMREAAAKSESQLRQMRATTQMSSTMYALWESSNAYVAQTAKVLDQMASLTQSNVVEQIRHTSQNYRKIRDQFSLQSSDPGGGGGGPRATPTDAQQDASAKVARRVKRAEAKLQLAQEELDTAQKSRDELITRFGSDLKAELLTKATERVKRALTLKAQAESELAELGQGAKASAPTSPMSNAAHQAATSVPLTKEVMKVLEGAEKQRTTVIRDAMKALARTYFLVLCGSCSPLLSFAQSVEGYSPMFELTSWLTKVMNVQVPMETTDLVTALAPSEKAWLMKQGNEEDSDAKALMDQTAAIQSLKTLMKQKEQLIKAVQEENALLKDEVNLLKSQQGFHEGAPERSSQGTEEPKRHPSIPIVALPPATGGQTPSITLGQKTSNKERKAVRLSGPSETDNFSLDDSQPLDASFPLLHKQHDSHTPKQRSSSNVAKHEKTSLLKRMATALKGGALNVHDESDHDTSDTDSIHDEREASGNGDHEEFILSEYIPSLKDRLKPELPPDLKTSDKLLELERRYEEYLWAMRNLHLANVIRNESWDCEGYMKGLDLEYGFQCYTVAIPSNIPLSREIYVESPDALDWGAPSMTANDWSLFAYETLLIIYHSLSQALIAREIAKLPTQDIQEIKLADFTVARPDKTELRAAEDRAGGRHRRYSLLVADDGDRDRPKSPPGAAKPFDDTSEAFTASILESNVVMIRNLIRTWRVRLKLAANDNTTLTSLLLPSGLEFGEEGYALGFSPLDVRYRVCRLHASWTMASLEIETQKLEKVMQTPLAKQWIFRQLHFIRISILMKVVRMSRFLPQLKGIYRWLNDWSSRPNWHQLISKSLPAPEIDDDRFLKGNFSQLVECLKLSLVVLADFLGALQADAWGVDVYKSRASSVQIDSYSPESTSPQDLKSQHQDDDGTASEGKVTNRRADDAGYGYRNAEGFLRLVALMSCISGVDKCIRYIVAEDEKTLVMGNPLSNVPSNSVSTDNDSADSSSEAELDSNPQDAGKVLFGQNWKGAVDDFDLSAVLNANSVDAYWQYEVPVQHLITAELCQLVCDAQAPTKMVIDAPTIVQTIIIATHVMQHGYDPTLWSHLRISQALMSLETVALYLIKALWDEALTNVSKKAQVADEFEVNLDTITDSGETTLPSQSPENGQQRALVPSNLMLSKDFLAHLNVMSSNFSNWLATATAAMVPRAGTVEEGTTVSGGVTDIGTQGNASEANLIEIRLIRILESTPPDLFDTLERPRGEYRNAKLGHNRHLIANCTAKITNSTDPDFCVLDLPVLNEIADRPNFFQQIESIREEPEGISLILPSRVERVIVELCLRRLISNKFRNEFFSTLCNYRVHYETDTLAMAIQLWERISDLLVLTPVKFPPQPPDVNHFSLLAPLPSILSGPIAQYDLYRFMIVQTIRNLFDRLFKDALQTIHNPTVEDAAFLPKIIDLDEKPENERLEIEKDWSRVIKKFADGCQNFLNELRAELIHYTPVWTQFLPGNQHALICMHAADDCLRMMFEDLNNSPFWPEEDLPPNSAPIVASFAHFDRLVKEIRIGTRFEQLLAEVEPLSTPLAASAATSLNKKLRGIESILDRCIRAETWKPISPPDSLHSVTAVDYMQFVHHILEAVWEFNASPEWILPIVIQFFGKMTRQFSDFVRSSTADPRLTQVAAKAQSIFKHLVSPIPRVDVSLISQLIGGARDRRKKKGLGGVIAFVGFGGKKTKRKDLAHQLQALQKQQAESEDEGMISPVSSGEEPGILSEGEQSQSSDEESEKERHRKKKSKKKADIEEAEITEELKELASKIGPVLAVSLTKVSAAVGKSPLPTWLTRLHNLFYFSSQLETIALRVIQVAIDQAASEDPQHNEILKALEKAGGRKAVFYDKHDRLDEETKKKFSEWKNQLESAVEQCRRMVNQRASETCYYTALRVVYHDLCCDLFEDLYSPSFSSGSNLTNIVESLDHTVLKFVNAAPQLYRADLLRFIVHELIKAWAMLITELGYAGHVFSPEDLAVVDSDLESIRQFAATHFIDTDMEVLSAQERGSNKDLPSQKINVFDYISEFIVFLGTQPLLLAQLGGNYQPEVKKKPLTSQSPGPTPGTSPMGQAPNEMANLFADMGVESAPAFNATDILGAKKKKGGGMFGGVLKAVGLKSKKPQSHPPPTTPDL